MAEITQAQLEANIAAIDTEIMSLIGALPSGQTAAQFVDYKIGQLEVKAGQKLKQLMEARDAYQKLLERIPYTTADVSSYDVDITGRDQSDSLGDE